MVRHKQARGGILGVEKQFRFELTLFILLIQCPANVNISYRASCKTALPVTRMAMKYSHGFIEKIPSLTTRTLPILALKAISTLKMMTTKLTTTSLQPKVFFVNWSMLYATARRERLQIQVRLRN